MQSLKGNARTQLGTHGTRRLRAAGQVPGVIYGHGRENVSFAISAHDLKGLMQQGERLVELDLDGQKDHYLIKQVQYDAFGHEVIHVDFTRVNLDETVQVTVPVVLRGTPAGATEGGVLVPGLAEIEIECPVVNIPEEIRVRLNDLKVGDLLRVRDLPAMEGVKYLADAEAMIAGCQLVAEEVAAPAAAVEAEETTQPEVIGKGKKEEEGEEGAAEGA